MWLHNTQTTDDGEPHPREIRLAGMTERATFDDHGNAYLENEDDGAILLEQLDYIEETSEPDYYEDEMADAAGAEAPESTGEDVNRGPTPEDAGDSFEGIEREEARPAATDVEADATVEEHDTDDGDAEVVADPAEAETVDPHDAERQDAEDAVVDRTRDDDPEYDREAQREGETGDDVTDAEGAEDAPETTDTRGDQDEAEAEAEDDDRPHTDGGYGVSGFGEE